MTNTIDRAKSDYESALDDLRNAIATFESITDAREFDRVAGITGRIFTYSSRVQLYANRMAQLADKGLL